MSSTFQWIAVRAGTALGRQVPSLFYQLYYREIYRELLSLTHDPKKTVDLAYRLGYISAEESAERQAAIFRLFPSKPEKVLEYVPLLWHIYFGSPMEGMTMEWDRSDPARPILNYYVQGDPMSFGVGEDPDRDNLPWDKFWNGNDGYGSLQAGLLTQCCSYVLQLKAQHERIMLHNPHNVMNGDPYFSFRCQILPADEFPDFHLSNIPIEFYHTLKGETAQEKQQQAFWNKLTQDIDIEILDELFDSPAGLLRVPLRKLAEKATKMSSEDFFGHFLNDERKFIQVLGYVYIHLFNEFGQIPETFLKNDTFAKVVGHIFRSTRVNALKFIPLSVVTDLKNYFIDVFTGITPVEFTENLKLISSEDTIELLFDGQARALEDLGIKFLELKPTLYEEFQRLPQTVSSAPLDLTEGNVSNPIPSVESPSILSPDSNKSPKNPLSFLTPPVGLSEEKAKLRNQLVAQLTDQVMLLSMVMISFPLQIILLAFYKTFTGSTELMSSFFRTLRENGQQVIDIVDRLKSI